MSNRFPPPLCRSPVGDEDLAIAALLHDSAEDQVGKARLEDVRNRFGERVARIVKACSDSLADTAKGERKAHWQERKEAYLAHLQAADDDILRVSLADKVHNARAILREARAKWQGGGDGAKAVYLIDNILESGSSRFDRDRVAPSSEDRLVRHLGVGLATLRRGGNQQAVGMIGGNAVVLPGGDGRVL